MNITKNIDEFKNLRFNLYKWRYETTVVNKIVLAFSFALITALLAQMKFYLPGNILVPITGQTFAVLLAGVLLGKWGGVSQCIYVGMGAMGIPWFANVTGSTIGYLFGFILAAFFLGFVTDKYIRSRSFFTILPLMFFATFALIYLPGIVYLYFYLGSIGISMGIIELLTIGVVPFILGDIVKTFAAASVAKIISPKRAYANEADAHKAKSWNIP